MVGVIVDLVLWDVEFCLGLDLFLLVLDEFSGCLVL